MGSSIITVPTSGQRHSSASLGVYFQGFIFLLDGGGNGAYCFQPRVAPIPFLQRKAVYLTRILTFLAVAFVVKIIFIRLWCSNMLHDYAELFQDNGVRFCLEFHHRRKVGGYVFRRQNVHR